MLLLRIVQRSRSGPRAASASGQALGVFRLNDRLDMSNIRKQSVEADKYQPVEDIEANCNRRWEQSLGSNRRIRTARIPRSRPVGRAVAAQRCLTLQMHYPVEFKPLFA